ncbi:MAG: hypothetical protein LBS97_02365 [Treponema sp.]|jgi:predicted  nucleic acid-binding Zn-ribbon protein|nr:hypothetical protein [Treponema sp.]
MGESSPSQNVRERLAAALREHAKLLEKQRATIEAGNAEKALAYCGLETQSLDWIMELQKTAAQMERGDRGESLQKELDTLQEHIRALATENQGLLKTRMTELQGQMDSLKNPYRNTRSVYARGGGSAAAILIEA